MTTDTNEQQSTDQQGIDPAKDEKDEKPLASPVVSKKENESQEPADPNDKEPTTKAAASKATGVKSDSPSGTDDGHGDAGEGAVNDADDTKAADVVDQTEPMSSSSTEQQITDTSSMTSKPVSGRDDPNQAGNLSSRASASSQTSGGRNTNILHKGDLVRFTKRKSGRIQGGLARIFRVRFPDNDETAEPISYDVEFVLGGKSNNVPRHELIYTTAEAEGLVDTGDDSGSGAGGGRGGRSSRLLRKRQAATNETQKEQEREEKEKNEKKEKADSEKAADGKKNKKGGVKKSRKDTKNTNDVSPAKSGKRKRGSKSDNETEDNASKASTKESSRRSTKRLSSMETEESDVNNAISEERMSNAQDMYTRHRKELERSIARLEKTDRFGFFLDQPPPGFDENYEEENGDNDGSDSDTGPNPQRRLGPRKEIHFPDQPPFNFIVVRKRLAAGRYEIDYVAQELKRREEIKGILVSTSKPGKDAPLKNPVIENDAIEAPDNSDNNALSYEGVAKSLRHPIGVDWDIFFSDITQMCDAAISRDPDGVDKGSGHLGFAASKIKKMMEEMYNSFGRRRKSEMEESETRHKFESVVLNCDNREAAMQGEWRKTAFPERKYERLETTSVVCDGLSDLDKSYAIYELGTSIPDSFVGLAYTYHDSGQQSETWMKTVAVETSQTTKKATKGKRRKKDLVDSSASSKYKSKAQKAAMALAKDDSVVRAQVKSTMNSLLIQVQDRVMTDLGVMHHPEARSANWDDGDHARNYRGGGVEVEQGSNAMSSSRGNPIPESGPSLAEVAEQPVWGIDCYTRKNVTAVIKSEFSSEIAVEFVEKWLLPAINACPVDLAYKMSTAAKILEGLQPVSGDRGSIEQADDKTQQQAQSHESREFLSIALDSKIKYHSPPWLKAAARLIRLASESLGDDFFRIHPKGHGSVVIGEQGLKANSLVTYYRGEVYPAWRWCEKLDAIEQTQNKLGLRPNLPDFYNMAMERPVKDPRGYSLLFVDASRKSGLGSSFSHSCDPTCEVRVVALNGKLSLSMTTLRDLERGEELTFDYNAVTESLNEYRFAICLCGHRNCRGSFLHFATADCYQQVLSRNSPIAVRFANLVRGCTKQVMSKEDSELLLKHGFNTAAFGAVSFNHHVDRTATPDSIENVPIWLRTYVAETLRYIEYERRALPVALLCNQMEKKEKNQEKLKGSVSAEKKSKSEKSRSQSLQRDANPNNDAGNATPGNSKPVAGSKPQPTYFFYLQHHKDHFRSIVEEEHGTELQGLDLSRAINKKASKVWNELSDEIKLGWKKRALDDWIEKGGIEKAKLEDERRRLAKKLSKSPKENVKPKEKQENVDSTSKNGMNIQNTNLPEPALKDEAIPHREITVEAADAEGWSAMEQRIQQLAQSLSRVGRVLDRHRESIFTKGDAPAVDSEVLRNLAPAPLVIMSDLEVVNWIWNDPNGVVHNLAEMVKQHFPKGSLLRKKIRGTRKNFPILDAFGDKSIIVPKDHKKGKACTTASDARRLVRQALLEFRKNIISCLALAEETFAESNVTKAHKSSSKGKKRKQDRISSQDSEPASSSSKSTKSVAGSKPQPSYFFFLQSKKHHFRAIVEKEEPNLQPGLELNNAVNKAASRAWNELSDDVKLSWKKKSIQAWEEKVRREGANSKKKKDEMPLKKQKIKKPTKKGILSATSANKTGENDGPSSRIKKEENSTFVEQKESVQDNAVASMSVVKAEDTDGENLQSKKVEVSVSTSEEVMRITGGGGDCSFSDVHNQTMESHVSGLKLSDAEVPVVSECSMSSAQQSNDVPDAHTSNAIEGIKSETLSIQSSEQLDAKSSRLDGLIKVTESARDSASVIPKVEHQLQRPISPNGVGPCISPLAVENHSINPEKNTSIGGPHCDESKNGSPGSAMDTAKCVPPSRGVSCDGNEHNEGGCLEVKKEQIGGNGLNDKEGAPASLESQVQTDKGTPASLESQVQTDKGTPASLESQVQTDKGTPASLESQVQTDKGTPASLESQVQTDKVADTKEDKKKTPPLSSEGVQYLTSWLLDPAHILCPYPTEEEKLKMAKDIGIDRKHLESWLIKHRKRIIFPDEQSIPIEWEGKDLEHWATFRKHRYMLEATADLLLLYASTNTFFLLKPFSQFDSTPIEVYARELGNEVPRHIAAEPPQSSVTSPDVVESISFNPSQDKYDVAVLANSKEEPIALPTRSDVSKVSCGEFCSPEDVITTVALNYSGDYVLSQLLQWFNGGIGQKPGLPDMFGCVMLPPVTGCWDCVEDCNEVEIATNGNSYTDCITEYKDKIQPQLADWIEDRALRGSPWAKDVAKYFCPKNSSSPDPTMPMGSPVLDFLVTGNDENIYHVSKALRESDIDGSTFAAQVDAKSSASDRLKSTVDEGMPAQAVANWVQCENPQCLKWRKLPWHVDIDLLPEKFFCKDNVWNRKSRSCAAPEDEWDMDDAPVKFDSNENFDIGAWFDVQREGKIGYCEAQVVETDFSSNVKRVKFHFYKLKSDLDEWIEVGSPRIAPHHSYTPAPKGGAKKPKQYFGFSKKKKKKHAKPIGSSSETGSGVSKPPVSMTDKKRKNEKQKKLKPRNIAETVNGKGLNTSPSKTISSSPNKRKFDVISPSRIQKQSPMKGLHSAALEVPTGNEGLFIKAPKPPVVGNLSVAAKASSTTGSFTPQFTSSSAAPNSSKTVNDISSHPSTKPKKFIKLPSAAHAYLNSWMKNHSTNSFPTREEKDKIIADTGLSDTQLRDWFARARKKLKKNEGGSFNPQSTLLGTMVPNPADSQKANASVPSTARDMSLSLPTSQETVSTSTNGILLSSSAQPVKHAEKPAMADGTQLDKLIFQLKENSGNKSAMVPPAHVDTNRAGVSRPLSSMESIAINKNGSPSKAGLSQEAKDYLSRWIALPEHSSNPFPTPSEKEKLMADLGIQDKRKLEGWFSRARKKMKSQEKPPSIPQVNGAFFGASLPVPPNQMKGKTNNGNGMETAHPEKEVLNVAPKLNVQRLPAIPPFSPVGSAQAATAGSTSMPLPIRPPPAPVHLPAPVRSNVSSAPLGTVAHPGGTVVTGRPGPQTYHGGNAPPSGSVGGFAPSEPSRQFVRPHTSYTAAPHIAPPSKSVNSNIKGNCSNASEASKPKALSKEVVSYLNNWLDENSSDPKPSLEQKSKIMADTGLEKRQLESWLYRARRRIKKNEQASNEIHNSSKPENASFPVASSGTKCFHGPVVTKRDHAIEPTHPRSFNVPAIPSFKVGQANPSIPLAHTPNFRDKEPGKRKPHFEQSRQDPMPKNHNSMTSSDNFPGRLPQQHVKTVGPTKAGGIKGHGYRLPSNVNSDPSKMDSSLYSPKPEPAPAKCSKTQPIHNKNQNYYNTHPSVVSQSNHMVRNNVNRQTEEIGTRKQLAPPKPGYHHSGSPQSHVSRPAPVTNRSYQQHDLLSYKKPNNDLPPSITHDTRPRIQFPNPSNQNQLTESTYQSNAIRQANEMEFRQNASRPNTEGQHQGYIPHNPQSTTNQSGRS